MRKMRKFISLAVVFTMLCSFVLTGFANAASDIEGTKYEEAIAKLAALDTIKGYEDGTFKPENTITRAELATVITFILGLQDAADLAKDNPTKFSDVKVNEWYTGYINIAANENVIAGYPDGTFKPNEKVSYSEAVTMLVNSLGLKQVVDKAGGTWPSNYMSKASQLGITKVLSNVDGAASAIRGDVFMMAWETLLQDQWGATGFNDLGEINYGNLHKTLLESKYPDYVYNNNGKMEAKYFEEVLVLNTPATKDTLKSNQVEIELEDIADMINVTLNKASDTKPYLSDNSGDRIVIILPDDMDASTLLGKEVTIFFGKDNEVKYIKATSDALAEGELESIDLANNKVKIDGTKYAFAKDADIYVNNIELNDEITGIDDDDINTKLTYINNLMNNMNGIVKAETLMNSSNKITSLQVTVAGTFNIATVDANDQDYKFEQFIVKSIRSDSAVVDLAGTRKFKIDDISEEDSNVVVVKNGKTVDASEIEAENVIQLSKNTDGNIRVINVTDNKVTGTLDRVATGYTLRIDGTSYEIGQNAKLSTENDIEETVNMNSDISTLLETEVTLYLDMNGNYILAMGESEVTLAMQYGIVARTPQASDIMYDDNDEPYLRLQIVDENGSKIAYKITGDNDDMFKQAKGNDIVRVVAGVGKDWTDEILTAFTKGTLIGFSTDSTGRTIKVTNLTKLENTGANIPNGIELDDTTTLSALTIPDNDNAVKDSTRSFKDNAGKTYYVTDNTIILNKHADNIEVVDGWGTLVSNANQAENMLRGTNPYAIFETKSRIVKYLIVSDDGTNYQATQDKYGVITDISVGKNSDGDKVWQVTVYTDGNETTYDVAGVDTNINTVLFGEEGDFVRYDIKNDKFIQEDENDVKIAMEEFLDDADYDGFIEDQVSDRDQMIVDEILGNLIVFKKVDGEAIDPISVADDAVVYDLSGNAPEMSKLSEIEGRMIMFLDTDNDASEYEIIIILE